MLSGVMKRFNSLMDEKRHRDAEQTAMDLRDLAPGNSAMVAAVETSRITGFHSDAVAVRDERAVLLVDLHGAVKRPVDGVATQGILMEHPMLPGFLVRMFALEPAGHTTLHQHPQQHLHYIVEGGGFFGGEGGSRQALRTGDVVLTEPNEFHQIVASEHAAMRFFDVAGPFQAGS